MMSTARIKIDHQKDEVFPNTWSDFTWAGENPQTLLGQYGVCIVLIYNKQVVGKGKTIQDAVEDAETHLAPDSSTITPIIKFLAPRSRIYRLQAKTANVTGSSACLYGRYAHRLDRDIKTTG